MPTDSGDSADQERIKMIEILGVKVSLWGLYGLASLQAIVFGCAWCVWILRKDRDGWLVIPIILGFIAELALVILMMSHAGMQP